MATQNTADERPWHHGAGMDGEMARAGLLVLLESSAHDFDFACNALRLWAVLIELEEPAPPGTRLLCGLPTAILDAVAEHALLLLGDALAADHPDAAGSCMEQARLLSLGVRRACLGLGRFDCAAWALACDIEDRVYALTPQTLTS